MSEVAASGPATGNASEPSTGFPLDQAISTALDGLKGGGDETKGATPGDDIADELTNPEVAKLARGARGKTDAGDSRDGEDAHAAADQAGAKTKAVAPDQGDDAKAFEPPQHWPAARKEAFAALAPEHKALVKEIARDLEGGFTRKSQEVADQVKFAQRVSGLFDDRTRAQLRQAGVDEVGAVQYLMNLQRFATDNPTGYIKQTMQTLGVTPEMLGPQMSPAAGEGKPDAQQQQPTGDAKLDELLADPAVKQLKSDLEQAKAVIADIYGRMDKRERAEYDYQQSQQRAHQTRLQSVITDFRNQLDDDGRPAFPHFDAVVRHMGALMDTDPDLRKLPDSSPEKMKAAYDMAVWARPDLRQSLVEAETGRRVAQAEKKRDAERAKRATAVRPAQGTPTGKARVSNLDDAILGAFHKIGM